MLHKFFVTQEHIKNSCPKDAFKCMVHLAVKEKIPDLMVQVGKYQLHLWTKGRNFFVQSRIAVIDWPEHVTANIIRHDNNMEVLPFDFVLEIPNEISVNI